MILNDDNTLYCERRQSDVAVSRCGEYQRRGECECESGARGWIEYTARLSTKNPSYSEMRRRYPTKREVEVDNKKKCSNCAGTVPKDWSTDLCRKCARIRNLGGEMAETSEETDAKVDALMGFAPTPDIKITKKDPGFQGGPALPEQTSTTATAVASKNLLERMGMADDRGPSVVLKTFDIDYPSQDDAIFNDVEDFVTHLLNGGIEVKIQVKVIVHPEGLS